MTRAERLELALIPLAAAAAWGVAARLPDAPGLGDLLLAGAVLLLLQGLLRDQIGRASCRERVCQYV